MSKPTPEERRLETEARLNVAIFAEAGQDVEESNPPSRERLVIIETLGRAMVYLYLTGRSKQHPHGKGNTPPDLWRELLWETIQDPERRRLSQMKEEEIT